MVAIAICVIFGVFSIITIHHTKHVFALTIINFLLTLVQHSFPQIGNFSLTIVGITVDVNDIYLISLLIIIILRNDNNILKIRRSNLLFLGYAFLIVFSIVIGAKQNGMCSDWVGDIRKFSKIMIPCIYFAKYPIKFNDRNIKILNYTMKTILIFCWICWGTALGLGVYITTNNSLRCIGSDWAFILSIYTVYLFYRDLILSEQKRITLETLIYIASIIILQHNTVYMTLAVGLLAVLIIKRNYLFKKHNMWILQVIGVLIIGIVVLSQIPNSPLTTMIGETMEKFSQAFSTSSGNEEGTIGTRYIVWKELVATLNSPFDWLFGKSMGTGYHVRYLSGTWQNSPHSGYIEGLMRVGLIGMFCLLGQIISSFIKHIRRGEALWASFLVMTLVYWYSYSYTTEIGFLIGMSMAMVSNLVYVENEENVCYENDFEKIDSCSGKNARPSI